jgi:hypothetical protein
MLLFFSPEERKKSGAMAKKPNEMGDTAREVIDIKITRYLGWLSDNLKRYYL